MNVDKFERIDAGQYRIETDVGRVELYRIRSDLWRMQSPFYSEDSRTMADALVAFPTFLKEARSRRMEHAEGAELLRKLGDPKVVKALMGTKHPIPRRASLGQTLHDYVEWVRSACPHRTDLIIEHCRPTIRKLATEEGGFA